MEEKFDITNNAIPLEDDELDEATGGSGLSEKFEEVKAKANAAGYRCMLPAATIETCICDHRYKWAKDKNHNFTLKQNIFGETYSKGYDTYYNIKCFRCAKTWNSIRVTR